MAGRGVFFSFVGSLVVLPRVSFLLLKVIIHVHAVCFKRVSRKCHGISALAMDQPRASRFRTIHGESPAFLHASFKKHLAAVDGNRGFPRRRRRDCLFNCPPVSLDSLTHCIRVKSKTLSKVN